MYLLSLLGHPNKSWIKSKKDRLFKCTQSKHARQMWDYESLDLLEQAAPSTTHSTRQKTIKRTKFLFFSQMPHLSSNDTAVAAATTQSPPCMSKTGHSYLTLWGIFHSQHPLVKRKALKSSRGTRREREWLQKQ